MRLDGSRVLITGASSGIGEALAEVAAARGGRLVLAGRNLSRLQGTAAAVSLGAPDLPLPVVVPCDVSDPASVRALCALAVERLGGLDVLVNNAGVSAYGRTEHAEIADFERMMAVNFYGPLYAMREAIPLMRRQGGGLIVNVASVAALHGVPYLAAYSASKAALAALAQSLRAELHESGVRLLTVYPGYTRTPLFDHETRLGGARRPLGGYASARGVARAIARAVERDAEELVLSPPGRALAVLRGVIPALVRRAMRQIAIQLRVEEQLSHV